MSETKDKAYELSTGLAELGAELEQGLFKTNDEAIDLVNAASCFIQEQAEALEKLKKALSYYADELHYKPYGFDGHGCDVTEDGGYIAREALQHD